MGKPDNMTPLINSELKWNFCGQQSLTAAQRVIILLSAWPSLRGRQKVTHASGTRAINLHVCTSAYQLLASRFTWGWCGACSCLPINQFALYNCTDLLQRETDEEWSVSCLTLKHQWLVDSEIKDLNSTMPKALVTGVWLSNRNMSE